MLGNRDTFYGVFFFQVNGGFERTTSSSFSLPGFTVSTCGQAEESEVVADGLTESELFHGTNTCILPFVKTLFKVYHSDHTVVRNSIRRLSSKYLSFSRNCCENKQEETFTMFELIFVVLKFLPINNTLKIEQ